MKICPKCNKEHNEESKFCSTKCSHSRTFSKESRRLKSLRTKQYFANMSIEEKKKYCQRQRNGLKKVWEQQRIKHEVQTLNNPFETLSLNQKRKRLFIEQNKKCCICKFEFWNQQPITLELDHVNGDRKNNSRENLRLICPNCHSQTKTWKTKNLKERPSIEKIVEVLKVSDSFYKALMMLNMNVHGRNYKRLKTIAKENNLELGV